MSDKVVSKELSLLKNCIDRYKTQEMCDKSVDAFLPTLKFVPNSFFNNKMLEKLGDVVFSNDDIVLFIEDSNNARFLVMIQALRLHMLIILTFMMIVVMMMILKTLSMLELWLCVKVVNNARHAKIYKQRINGLQHGIQQDAKVWLLHSKR